MEREWSQEKGRGRRMKARAGRRAVGLISRRVVGHWKAGGKSTMQQAQRRGT